MFFLHILKHVSFEFKSSNFMFKSNYYGFKPHRYDFLFCFYFFNMAEPGFHRFHSECGQIFELIKRPLFTDCNRVRRSSEQCENFENPLCLFRMLPLFFRKPEAEDG